MPSTRLHDPETSKAAAAAPRKLKPLQLRILQAYRVYGAMDDRQLLQVINDMERELGFTRFSSPSSVRSRRSELSKRNTERLRQLREAWWKEVAVAPATEREEKEMERQADAAARRFLAVEGFRDPIWDTGQRIRLPDTNTRAIVWGPVPQIASPQADLFAVAHEATI